MNHYPSQQPDKQAGWLVALLLISFLVLSFAVVFNRHDVEGCLKVIKSLEVGYRVGSLVVDDLLVGGLTAC